MDLSIFKMDLKTTRFHDAPDIERRTSRVAPISLNSHPTATLQPRCAGGWHALQHTDAVERCGIRASANPLLGVTEVTSLAEATLRSSAAEGDGCKPDDAVLGSLRASMRTSQQRGALASRTVGETRCMELHGNTLSGGGGVERVPTSSPDLDVIRAALESSPLRSWGEVAHACAAKSGRRAPSRDGVGCCTARPYTIRGRAAIGLTYSTTVPQNVKMYPTRGSSGAESSGSGAAAAALADVRAGLPQVLHTQKFGCDGVRRCLLGEQTRSISGCGEEEEMMMRRSGRAAECRPPALASEEEMRRRSGRAAECRSASWGASEPRGVFGGEVSYDILSGLRLVSSSSVPRVHSHTTDAVVWLAAAWGGAEEAASWLGGAAGGGGPLAMERAVGRGWYPLWFPPVLSS